MANAVNQILTVDLSMRVVEGSRVTSKSNGKKPNDAMADIWFERCWPHSGDLGVGHASDRCGGGGVWGEGCGGREARRTEGSTFAGNTG